MGPLISEEQLNTVLEYVEIGIKEGATLAYGGKRLSEGEYAKGFFMELTIFTDVTPDMTIVREEIFGPVVVIQKFHTEEEAIRLANDTEYGLAAGVFSSDSEKALRVVGKLRAGITWINTYGPVYPQAPWGGYKRSGIGRELGTLGLEDYTEVKQINTTAHRMVRATVKFLTSTGLRIISINSASTHPKRYYRPLHRNEILS